MNIFKDYSGFHGEIHAEHLNNALEEFFSLSKDIRVKLDKKAYLFDEYVWTVLRGINSILAYDSADRGFHANCDLRQFIMGKELSSEKCKHPLLKVVREHIEKHPLNFQERSTRADLHSIALASKYFSHVVSENEKEGFDRIRAVVDIVRVRELYDGLCVLLGSEELMERLNLVIRQRFIIANSMAVFAQGLTANLLYSLTNRDIETNKPIFVLALEGRWF